ncbi:MAG: molybdopterin-guanine dinucleotide biosynthesis protein B [Candidatus Eisenbacteria bacterium]
MLTGFEGRVIGVCGLKDTGKTAVVEGLVKFLKEKDFTVGTVKHAHSEIALDSEGKDSIRHLGAGADCVVTIGERLVQVMVRPDGVGASDSGGKIGGGGIGEGDLGVSDLEAALARYLASCDYVVVEGFKGLDIPKIVVLGADSAMSGGLKNIVALAYRGNPCECRSGDLPGQFQGLPLLAIDEVEKIGGMLFDRGILQAPGARAHLLVNGKPIPMNEFVRSALAGVLEGFVGSLRDVEAPAKIEISVKHPKA